MALIKGMAVVLRSLAQCQQIRLRRGPLLLSDNLRTLFSQVSEGMDDTFFLACPSY
jgi:hypothetical protein